MKIGKVFKYIDDTLMRSCCHTYIYETIELKKIHRAMINNLYVALFLFLMAFILYGFIIPFTQQHKQPLLEFSLVLIELSLLFYTCVLEYKESKLINKAKERVEKQSTLRMENPKNSTKIKLKNELMFTCENNKEQEINK